MYEKFSQLLQEHNKTAYRVAKDTGSNQATLSGWKQGKGTPKVDKLMILADYFGVDVNYFLTK